MRIGKEIVYRRAQINDVQGLVDLRVQLLKTIRDHPENYETKAVRESIQKNFATAIPSSDFITWVAEYDGKIVATSGMVVWQKPTIDGEVKSGKVGYLLNFYTIPEARRKGIATRLLNELIREAKSMGLRYLHLHTSKDGEPVYRKAGFVEPKMPELKLNLE